MAYPYGTGSGVTFMKKTAKTDKHFFIKGAMVLFLVIYLGTLYNSDNARNVPVEQIAHSGAGSEYYFFKSGRTNGSETLLSDG